MLQAFFNIFRIPDLRNRVFFTLGMLVIYRIGFWIPLPGVDEQKIAEAAALAVEGATGWGRVLQYASIFSGGSLSQSTIRWSYVARRARRWMSRACPKTERSAIPSCR